MVGVVEQHLDGKNMTTFYGSSEETKPADSTVADGSVFVETDTHDIYMYDATAEEWKEW